MPNNKILFIVEGDNDEVSFLRRLLAKCFTGHDYEIYSYRCNIHVLAQVLYDEYPDFEEDEIDIQLVLKSKETDKHKRFLLSQRYRDVFLVFDYDPQHDHPHFDTVLRMLKYFSDSSNHGKLFINYPMMQSYKHFSVLPDDSFATRLVTIEECRHYKRLVGDSSSFTDINSYSYITFVSIIVHHLRKANLLLTGNYTTPLCEEYLTWSGADIYEAQCRQVDQCGSVMVLNTSLFLGVDYRPNEFFRTISKRACEFDI